MGFALCALTAAPCVWRVTQAGGACAATLRRRSMWRRELASPFGDRIAPIVVYEDPNRASIGGEFFIWPASLVLCDYLFRNPSVVREHAVLELGASHGLAAMAARAAGARRVLATDQEEVVSFLASNVDANPTHNVEVAALEWGVNMGAWCQQHGRNFDVVVGSDLTFNRDSFLPLLSTLQQLMCHTDGLLDAAENPRRALLLHDDDSVPGGKYLRNEFFHKAAAPYFHVTRADLRSADLSQEKRGAKGNAFDSSTVHGYWLAPRADAPNVPAVACAESLQKWNRARLEESERNKDSDSSSQKKRVGVTISEMLEHFRPGNSEGAKAPNLPAPAAREDAKAPKPPAPSAHGAEAKKRQDTCDAKGPKPGSAQGLDADAILVRANEGCSGEVQLESPPNAQPAASLQTCAPEGKTETAAQPCQREDEKARADTRESTGAHWWDTDMGDYEPLEFTEEMLRGVDEGRTRVIDPQSPATWDDLVKEELAAAAKSGLWRNITVDTSHLPNLADGDQGEEEEDDDEELEVVDLDTLRAAAWDRAGMEMPGPARPAPAAHAAQSRPASTTSSVSAPYRAPAKPKPPVQAKPPTCNQPTVSGPNTQEEGAPHEQTSKGSTAQATAAGTSAPQVHAEGCTDSAQEGTSEGVLKPEVCTPPAAAADTPVACAVGGDEDWDLDDLD